MNQDRRYPDKKLGHRMPRVAQQPSVAKPSYPDRAVVADIVGGRGQTRGSMAVETRHNRLACQVSSRRVSLILFIMFSMAACEKPVDPPGPPMLVALSGPSTVTGTYTGQRGTCDYAIDAAATGGKSGDEATWQGGTFIWTKETGETERDEVSAAELAQWFGGGNIATGQQRRASMHASWDAPFRIRHEFRYGARGQTQAAVYEMSCTFVRSAPVNAVSVSPPSATVVIGGSTQFTADLRDVVGNTLTGRSVSWSISNPSVATVTSSGIVTGVAAGTTTVTATSEGRSATAQVTVTPPVAPVASVSVSPASSSVTVGQTIQLTATARDASGNVLSGRPVTWSSSNAAVASVSSSGVVTGVAAGTAVVTATSEGKTGAAQIAVAAPPSGIRIVPNPIACTVGRTAFVDVQEVATGQLVGGAPIFSSNNTAVAAVANTYGHHGVVSCNAAGTATITATHSGRTATATVNVTAAPPPPPPPPPPPSVTVTISNRLIQPVNISINNGAVTGSVPAQSTRQVTVQNASSISLGWELVRPVVGGRPLGDAISATFPTVTNPSQAVSFEINNQLSNGGIFAPLITNTGSQTWLMGVNMGLQSENRCNCTVGPGQSRVFIGYYRYFSNSNVRAYLSSNGYSGQYFYWNSIQVPVGSGAVELR